MKLNEQGLETIKAIASSDLPIVEVVLCDNDSIFIPRHVASGIMLIYNAINTDNKKRMEKMEVLHLLHVHELAEQDNIIQTKIISTKIQS